MDSKPLTAGEIEELRRIADLEEPTLHDLAEVASQLGRIVAMLDAADTALVLNADGSVSPLLAPPSDAAVREAVDMCPCVADDLEADGQKNAASWVRTLIRAVQAPRLTGEQVDMLRKAGDMLDGLVDEYPGHRDEVDDFKSAFPEVFGVQHG